MFQQRIQREKFCNFVRLKTVYWQFKSSWCIVIFSIFSFLHIFVVVNRFGVFWHDCEVCRNDITRSQEFKGWNVKITKSVEKQLLRLSLHAIRSKLFCQQDSTFDEITLFQCYCLAVSFCSAWIAFYYLICVNYFRNQRILYHVATKRKLSANSV